MRMRNSADLSRLILRLRPQNVVVVVMVESVASLVPCMYQKDGVDMAC